jgi:peptidoglycan/LPS O-acetylase OafA/YrhL
VTPAPAASIAAAPLGDAGGPAMRNKPYYPVLDGVRGLAAIAVVGLHLTSLFLAGHRPLHAHLAVDMFFMLSGLVIANTYEARLLQTMSLGQFLSLRLIRLYPLTLLGVLAGALALLGALAGDHALGLNNVCLSILSSALLIPSPFLLSFRAWSFPGNSPLWSLSVELVVNIAYALIARALGLRLLAGLIVLGAVALVLIAFTHQGLDVGFAWQAYPLGLARAAGSFLAGVLIYRLCHGRAALGRWAHLVPLIMLALLFAPLGKSAVFDSLVVVCVFPAALVIAMRAPPAGALDEVWKTLGAYSYPVYVLHYPIIVILARATKPLQGTPAMLFATMAATAVLVGLCAHLALRFYDLPARRILRRLFELRRPQGAPQPIHAPL